MRLDSYTKEMMDENSFIDMSYIYLQDKGKETDLYEIIDKFKAVGEYNDSEIEQRVLQFYTDLNTDGRFLSIGEGVWGLRDWYSMDDISDKIAPTIHKIDLVVEEEPEILEENPEEVFDQDKALVEDDTEDLDTPVENDDEDDIDEAIGEDLEYDDTDDLEDSYEDEDDL